MATVEDEDLSAPLDGATATAAVGDAPAKKAAAKKAGAKKAATKKAAAKKSAKKAAAKKAVAKKAPTTNPKYPRHSIEKALRIPQAILNQNAGNYSTREEAVGYIGAASLSGGLNVEIGSANKYGFLESEDGLIRPSDRAKRALAPESESDRISALREALLNAPDLAEVYSHYRGENLPDEQYFSNALVNRFGIPPDKVPEFREIFLDSLRAAQLLDETGDQAKLIDIGRDDATKAAVVKTTKAAAKQAPGSEGSCFVMQPFAPPLGDYFETIYRPAIEQANLRAIRADDDIFGTGKIMDQIWRGISDARVLIAELTTKNPNVFYELGLAHAVQKPVILVSSNEDDVPFDLRHIRVVVYDTADPFWGQKLIDKIADKVRSALEDPEEAIFRLSSIE